MKRIRARMLITFVFLLTASLVQAEFKTKSLGGGWKAVTRQIDPFDKSKISIVEISKGSFTFTCDELNISAPSYGYESLSFRASLKYIVDQNPSVDKEGLYSTYLGGSDLLTDDRYFSFKMLKSDVDSFKKGNKIKVAGKYATTGWVTKKLNLLGFTKNYKKMCN